MNTLAKGRSCLVAGGAGFVGSNLVRRLLDLGMAVDVIDDLSTGRMENISEFRENPSFRFIKADISANGSWQSRFRRRYSYIYHLACPTGVPNIEVLGEQMLLASSAGTLNLLKVAERSRAKFLFASTAEAYGDPEVFPQRESYVGNVDPVGPRSPYEEGKRYGEALTRYYGRKHGVEVYIARIFNTYGPGMSLNDQRVIPQMLSRAISGRPLTIFGNGSQTRTFLYIDDLLCGLLRIMEAGAAGEVYNVGGSEQITIAELFGAVRSVTGLQVTASHEAHFLPDHRGRCPDTTKLQELGWRQSVSLEDGLRKSLRNFLRIQSQRESPRIRNLTPVSSTPVQPAVGAEMAVSIHS